MDATPSHIRIVMESIRLHANDGQLDQAELEQLVATLEGGELPLEQSLSAYERGVALYRQCQQALEQAQLRVNLLNDPAQPETAVAFDPPSA